MKRRESIKAAKTAIAAADKETKYLQEDAKEFAEYLGIEDGNALFFAVQEHAENTAQKLGILIDSKVKVASQSGEYEKILDKVTDPDIIAHCPELKDAAQNIRNQLAQGGEDATHQSGIL